jgi:hypothetical protein
MIDLPRDGLVAVVKRDGPTCQLTAPVLAELAARGALTVLRQLADDHFDAIVTLLVE